VTTDREDHADVGDPRGPEGLEETYDIKATTTPSGVTHLTFTKRH